MIATSNEEFGYEEWGEWAQERAGYIDFFERELPEIKFLERKGYLDFPEDLEINSSEEIEAILDGEYRWEDKQENQAESLFVVYDLPIELDRAEEEILAEGTLGEKIIYRFIELKSVYRDLKTDLITDE